MAQALLLPMKWSHWQIAVVVGRLGGHQAVLGRERWIGFQFGQVIGVLHGTAVNRNIAASEHRVLLGICKAASSFAPLATVVVVAFRGSPGLCAQIAIELEGKKSNRGGLSWTLAG